ncbi:CoA ester lyase [Catenulispora subtropica]|uniref:CoA ester lyase n=1 Tax=Catenulispora subtropica TaxID=450798 RepID=A0ABP5C2F8_9ACTN
MSTDHAAHPETATAHREHSASTPGTYGTGFGPIVALYLPATRPDRFGKALTVGADAVILDLEDAVPAAAKDSARAEAVRLLSDSTREISDTAVHVRINSLSSPWWKRDAATLGELAARRPESRPAAVRVPKVESPEDIRRVAELLGHQIPLYCLIESARGLEAAYEIAGAHPAVAGVALGEADLAGDLGVTGEGLAWARSRLVVAARAAGLPSPALSAYPRLDDEAGLYESCVAGRRAGFLGRSVLHPKQIPAVIRAFTPSTAEVASAEATLSALGSADIMEGGTAVLADGSFVDRAMAEAASRTLALRRHTAQLARRAGLDEAGAEPESS